ncbi:YfjI family protein, partial [Allochromatium vinosum]|uniref:YfjI family protein n=1 Tax=Allochromatium vinosum TaxID=1049 RepID=UPI001902E7F2
DLERLAEYEHQHQPVELACFSPDEGKTADAPLAEVQAPESIRDRLGEEPARFPIALADTVTGPITRRREVTWSELAKRLKSVEVGAKDGPLWLAGDHAPGPRGNEHVRSVSVLALDVEAKTARNPETGIKTVIGPEPPTLQEMAAEIELCGWRAILHTTHSHLDPGIQPPGVAHHRYRLVLALDRPLQPGELDVFGRHVASVLGISDCFDPSTLKPSQPLYLPRAPQERLIYFGHVTIKGDPLPVESLLNAARAAQDALRAAAGKRQGPQTASVIDSFNAAHDVRELLRHHGYIPKRGNRWMHPESTTGMAGVRLLPESDPPRVFSSHGCCPLNDGHAHDAFSVWCILAHAGDTKAAVREAARLLGMEGERQTSERQRQENREPGGAANPANSANRPAAQWPEPEPLRAPMAEAEPYPVNALGDVLGTAAIALHESVKAPLALCAQSVLAAASFAAQAHFDAHMPWGEIKPLSLAMLTVGESGERKSGVDDLVLGAAKAQERAEMSAYEADMESFESEMAAWKAASEQAKKRASGKDRGKLEDFRREAAEIGPPPVAPVLPLRFVTDPTVEGLYKLLAIGQPSVALFSDEGGLLIGGHALNSDNALKTLARWCKLWDGSPFDRVRAGDGSGILYGRRMALHQLAQPDIMSTLLSDPTANGQGFLARCLVAWPQSTIGTRHIEQYEWAGDRPEIRRLFGKLKTLFETPPRAKDQRGQVLDPQPLPLSPDAKAMAVQAGNQFESLMAPGAPLCEIRDRGSKAMDNAIRIAGVLTVIEQGLAAREISADHFARALTLIQWYLAEALRIRGAAAIPQAVTDAEALLAWIRERRISLFRSAPVLTRGPAQLRNKVRFTAAVAELVGNGYLVEASPGTEVDGVKAKLAWRVHPHVL